MNKNILQTIIICLSLFILYTCVSRTLKELTFAATFDSAQLKPPGYDYREFIPFLKSIDEVGYITEQDLSSESFDTKHFFFAQFTLAPTVLKIGDSSQEYLLIETSSWMFPFHTLQKLNAEMIHINKTGRTILARKIQ